MSKNSAKQNVDQLREWLKTMKIKTRVKPKAQRVESPGLLIRVKRKSMTNINIQVWTIDIIICECTYKCICTCDNK